MAAASSTKRLQDEASCSLCHKYFTEPVSIDYGHSFCQSCITQLWEERYFDFSCPQCGEISVGRKFRPNKELGNVVEIAKRIKLEMAESVGGEVMCEMHQEPLKLFCKDKQKLMCSTCTESKDLTTLAFVPVEEADREYKEELETQLQAWRKKREKAFSDHKKEKNRFKGILVKVDIEKQKIASKFEEVQKFLKQQEKTLLNHLEELVKEEEEFVTRVSGEICLMDALIREMEEKSQQPPNAFLLDIGETLSKSKVEFQEQDGCSEVEKKLHAFSKKYNVLLEALRAFTEDLPRQLEVKWVDVTLDPDTANCNLLVSDNRKVLKPGDNKRKLIDYPQRFSSSSCVLGCEGFTSGRYYWEVQLQTYSNWAVGVARASVKRNEDLKLQPDEGICTVTEACRQYPNIIGIYLDLDNGRNRVLFFNAATGKVLRAYSLTSWKGEKIYPFFFMKPPFSFCLGSSLMELCSYKR